MKKRFKKGTNVSVVDDTFTGVVVNQLGDKVIIKTGDGFELEYNAEQLIIEGSILSKTTSVDIYKAISKKDAQQKKAKVLKKKERLKPAMEVDLHIHHLVKSTKGMSKHDILSLQLDTAKRQLELAIKKHIQRMVFIHGVGEGVLRLELEYLFNRYDNVRYYDANYQKYGLGATEVYISQNVK
ncbi:MAG: Smr/MutS family protein [Flavobacteriaceae bacterium]|nr:Smr/MutS family protein [Flavobacteriaceae bacterium]